MKKFAIVIIGILLIAGLVACGGKGDSILSETISRCQKSAIPLLRKPYNLDYESTEIQPMSDKKASVKP